MKYFKNVQSYENLKKQYKELIKDNHPDNGGNEEAMKEINVQFDALFAIWKDCRQKSDETAETAESIRKNFYTQYGWEGKRYDPRMSTTEIAKTIRAYCKEKYPTWKFSVTSSYFAGGSEINIAVMEAPVDIFNREYFSLPMDNDLRNYRRPGYRHDCWENFEKMTEENNYDLQIHRITDNRDDYDYLNDIGYAVILDVYGFMQSYNYDDSDSMTDYFDCNFYCNLNIGKWNKGFRIVPKTARIKNKKNVPAAQKNEKQEGSDDAALKSGYTYTVTKDTDTRDGSALWVVKITEHLDKEAYIAENKAMKQRGGYYSKYKHGFVFREDPTNKLKA